jgi:hypothetical protein
MSDFLPMDLYPWADYRDAAGEWHGVPGPVVELKMECGHVRKAIYHGKRTKGGGEAWAFWTHEGDPIGTAEPVGWRHLRLIA